MLRYFKINPSDHLLKCSFLFHLENFEIQNDVLQEKFPQLVETVLKSKLKNHKIKCTRKKRTLIARLIDESCKKYDIAKLKTKIGR